MAIYVISLVYRDHRGYDAAEYEIEANNIRQAKGDAKVFAKEERKRTGGSVRIARVENERDYNRRVDRTL